MFCKLLLGSIFLTKTIIGSTDDCVAGPGSDVAALPKPVTTPTGIYAKLPVDVTDIITGYLTVKDLGRLSQTDKHHRGILKNQVDIRKFFSNEHGISDELLGMLDRARVHGVRVNLGIKIYTFNATNLDQLSQLLSHGGAIKSLNLSDNSIGVEGAIALATSPTLTNLTSLNLKWNNIGDEGARAIATSPYLAHLTSLDLGG